ncbi:hexamerin-like, partial [Belonocnema kinseyi]|uniref:hexamerin-like n=1 Tax=Belonocnema kinseyi TaxID=2817044 RepID=UPI00143DBC21
LTEAIDSGYFVDKVGNKISIFDDDGITNLGTILEGNKDSLNLEYYGSYDQLLRNMFDHISAKSDKVSYVPSALQFFVTNMRDPLFYRITDMVMNMFWRFKERQPLYRHEDLSYPGVHIESVDAGKILTYFEPFDVTINNALNVRNLKDGLSFNIKTRNYRLNHQPWNITLTLNSHKHTRTSIRVFLCPVDENQDLYAFVRKNYMKYVVQIDKWTERLQPGTNIIVRNSRNAMFTQNFKQDAESYLEFYKKLHKAGEKNEKFVFYPPHYGFPNNLLIPKGRPEGIRYKVIVFLHSFEALRTHEILLFGEHAYDGKPLGFPLDRPVVPGIFELPNAFVTDTMIYHKPLRGLPPDSGGDGYEIPELAAYYRALRSPEEGYLVGV